MTALPPAITGERTKYAPRPAARRITVGSLGRDGQRRCVTAVGLVLLTVLCLTACGGGGTSGSGSSSAANRPQPSEGPRTTGQAGESLRRGLLRVGDMPSGWILNAESAGSPEDTDICGTNLATLERHREKLGEAAIGFQRGESGPFFAETIAAYPPGLAERVMAELAAAVQTCREITVRDEEGSISTWQLSPLPFPQFGDQIIAFREYWAANAVEATVIYIRRGDRIMVLLHIAIGTPVDRLETEALVSRAYERFAQLEAGR